MDSVQEMVSNGDAGESEENSEGLTEPAYIRILREYYNDKYAGQTGKVFFVDLTGDGEEEMIAIEKEQGEEEERGLDAKYSLRIFSCRNNAVELIYEAAVEKQYFKSTGINYYLVLEKEDTYLLACHWNTDSDEQVHIEKVSFRNTENEFPEISELSQEEYERINHSGILLFGSSVNTAFTWESNINMELSDYQSLLSHREELRAALEIMENSEETILDYAAIYEDDRKCVFAVTGAISKDRIEAEGIASGYEGPISVWASCDGKTEKLESIDLKYDGMPLLWTGNSIYQFGNTYHFFVETIGQLGGNVQHKFCYEDGEVREVDDSRFFVRDGNGKVQMKISHKVECLDEGSDQYFYTESYTDIFYYEHQYAEYGTELAADNVLEHFENCNEILQIIGEKFKETDSILGWDRTYTCHLDKIELDSIRKAENNVYFLNYKVYGQIDWFGSSTWAHAVVEKKDNRLEYKEIVFGKKEGQSAAGLPVYYGKDRGLAEASKSEDELAALIEESSGKSITGSCYDDYDGDGKYELFAYLSTEEEYGDEDCSIWFSDGEKTAFVTEVKEGYFMNHIGVLQFGKVKHFYLELTGIVAAMRSITTLCALENRTPKVIIKDQNVLLVSENGRTYCSVGEYETYDFYASNRYYEKYSIFYKDGEYWEYASKPISEKDLLEYTNGKEILIQVMEIARNLYVEDDIYWDRDYSQYPYIEIEDILLNSEGLIFINMRHWKSEEEAEYYKNLTQDELMTALLNIDSEVASYPSEARLSIKDNELQIEEIIYGHKKLNGTEFKPLYPD